MGRLNKEVAATIRDNLAFRMTVALANPKAYEHNLAELADVLADDIVKRLTPAGRAALGASDE